MCTEPDMYSMQTLADLTMKQFKMTEHVGFKMTTTKLGSNDSLTSLEKAMIRNSCNQTKNTTLKRDCEYITVSIRYIYIHKDNVPEAALAAMCRLSYR